jgi:hypothetical protein
MTFVNPSIAAAAKRTGKCIQCVYEKDVVLGLPCGDVDRPRLTINAARFRASLKIRLCSSAPLRRRAFRRGV